MKKVINSKKPGKKKEDIEKGERIFEAISYLKAKGIIKEQRDLARLIGRAEESISRAINGVPGYGNGIIRKLVNLCSDLNFEYLMNGVGELDEPEDGIGLIVKESEIIYSKRTENGFSLIESSESLDAIPEEFRKWIKPYYPEIKVGAGMEMGFYRQRTKYFILVPNSEKVEFWAPVEGQSMYPKYNNRDLVGLAPIHFDGVFGGNNYVVELKTGSAHLKRVDFVKGDDSLINLHSYNPDFEDKIVEIEKIQGFFKVYMHIGFE